MQLLYDELFMPDPLALHTADSQQAPKHLNREADIAMIIL